MARNDGIDRTLARNQDLETPADVAKVQEHNEREKDRYSNAGHRAGTHFAECSLQSLPRTIM